MEASIRSHYEIGAKVFGRFPMGETFPAGEGNMRVELERNWDDGCARLWDPLVDVLPLVIRKQEQESSSGLFLFPYWPAQWWFAGSLSTDSLMEILSADLNHITASSLK